MKWTDNNQQTNTPHTSYKLLTPNAANKNSTQKNNNIYAAHICPCYTHTKSVLQQIA